MQSPPGRSPNVPWGLELQQPPRDLAVTLTRTECQQLRVVTLDLPPSRSPAKGANSPWRKPLAGCAPP